MPDMRGTGYVITEILVWLIAAALIGVVVGWLIRGWRTDKKIRRRAEASLEQERERAADLAERLAEAEAKATDAEGKHALVSGENDRLAARVAELEAAAEADDEPSDDDDADGDGDGEDDTEDMLEADDGEEDVVLPDKETATARVALIAARTRSAGDVVDDDLELIHGVGPKLAGLLKDMGITSFAQVARFESDDIAHVAAALDDFSGRIESDDWMGSAAEQHLAKYGEPVADS